MLIISYFSNNQLMNIINELNKNFDFSQITLANPSPVQGGSYFTKLLYNDKPLYLQLPKCNTKQGVVVTNNNKKIYSDLMFSNLENDLIDWFENLEITCQKLIYSKKDIWFQSDMELDDIEQMMTSIMRPYKSGKFMLIRSSIPNNKQIKKTNCLIYDENEIPMTLEDIKEDNELIPLICVEGIRFTSRSFQIEINLSQIMIISTMPELSSSCLIKHKNNRPIENVNNTKVDNEDIIKSSLEEPDTLEECNDIKNLETPTNLIDTEVISDPIELDDYIDNDKNLEESISSDEKDNIQESETIESNNCIKENNEIDEETLEVNNYTLEDSCIPEYLETTENMSENSDSEILSNILENTNVSDNLEKVTILDENNILDIDKDRLQEIELDCDNIDDTIELRNPNEVYYNLYKTARNKAKELKKASLEAYLQAENIKSKFMLDNIEDSDDE